MDADDQNRRARDSTSRIKPSECWELLNRAGFGRLAVAASGGVDIFPLNFVVDGESIVFRTSEGTKLTEMLHEAAVALESDDRDPVEGVAWSVVAKGRPHVLDNDADIAAAQALGIETWSATSRKMTFVRITVTEMSGRRLRTAPST